MGTSFGKSSDPNAGLQPIASCCFSKKPWPVRDRSILFRRGHESEPGRFLCQQSPMSGSRTSCVPAKKYRPEASICQEVPGKSRSVPETRSEHRESSQRFFWKTWCYLRGPSGSFRASLRDRQCPIPCESNKIQTNSWRGKSSPCSPPTPQQNACES